MVQYDEYRIFITDGQSPFNQRATTSFRQPAFCILQKPVCAPNDEIKTPLPLDKPSNDVEKPPKVRTCTYNMTPFKGVTFKVGHSVDIGLAITNSVSDMVNPSSLVTKAPSHFKQLNDTTYISYEAGTFPVSVKAEYNGGFTCSITFDVTFA